MIDAWTTAEAITGASSNGASASGSTTPPPPPSPATPPPPSGGGTATVAPLATASGPALDPAIVWPGHADPVTGDVAAQLERAASGPA